MKTKGRFLSMALVALFAIALFPAATYGSEGINVTIDGERVNFEDQQPVIINGRVLVPVRGVFEQLGFEVSFWAPPSSPSGRGQVTLRSANHTAALFIGSSNFYVNSIDGQLLLILLAEDGSFTVVDDSEESSEFVRIMRDEFQREIMNAELLNFDVPPQIIGGRTMLPIRALVESIGYYVHWDGVTETVFISSTPFEGQAVIPEDGVEYIAIRGNRHSKSLTELDLIGQDLNNEDILPLRYMTNLTS